MKGLRLEGSNFRLGGIAPLQGLYRLFEFLCALPFRLRGRKEIKFTCKIENNIHINLLEDRDGEAGFRKAIG